MQNAEQIFQNFINFPGFPFKHGITTTNAGDFYYQNENKHLDFLEIMGKNTLARVVPQHGDEIVEIKNLSSKLNYYLCDAIIWSGAGNTSQDPILVCPTADCPILTISNKKLSILAIIHSGRASTESKIVPQVIEMLKRKYDIPPQKLHIGLWPGICSGCYTVDEESAQNFLAKTINGEGIIYLNLEQEIRNQLLDQNIPPNNISGLEYCSAHSVGEDGEFIFYSYRRNETPERNLIWISL